MRVYNILNHLREHHHVDFVAPSFGDHVSPLHPDDHIIGLPPMSKLRRVFSLFALAPYHAALVGDRRINAYIEDLVGKRRYDLIYLHYIYSLQYIPGKVEGPVVLDQQNVDRDLWFRKFHNHANSLLLRLYSLINAYKTIQFETRHLKRIQAYVSISEQDRSDTRAYVNHFVRDFLVAPNGVNISAFPEKPRPETSPRSMTLGFLGSLDLSINQRAVEELCFDILPRVRGELAGWDINVLVVGKNPPGRITGLGDINRKIRIVGAVPDVSDYLYQMDVMVLPLREGGGSKLRVLEGMAAGLPVIGTNLAFIGLDGLKHNQNCCYADTTGEMVQAICDLAQDPAKRRKIGLQARELTLRKYEWGKIIQDLSRELGAVSSSASSC